jgi:hypothetical protein
MQRPCHVRAMCNRVMDLILGITMCAFVEGCHGIADADCDPPHDFHAVGDFLVVDQARDERLEDSDQNVNCSESRVEPVVDETLAGGGVRDGVRGGLGARDGGDGGGSGLLAR